MSQRIVRVNELLKREIGQILRTDYQAKAVYITITEVDTSPDLRHAKVHYSVLGDEKNERMAAQLLGRIGGTLRKRVAKHITLKYLPHLEFVLDRSIARGTNLIERMDDIINDDT